MRHNRTSALYEVFAAYGNATKTAKALGVTKQAVAAWKVVPFRHIKQIMDDTGLAREKIRPDLFQ